MSIAEMTWSGDIFMDAVQALMAKRLDRAARHAHNEIKKKISLAGTGYASIAHDREEIAGQYRTGKLFTRKIHYRKKQRIYRFATSKAGEPPRKQTGTLRRNVAYETDSSTLTARVGVGGPPVSAERPYAIFLELGTRKMGGPHPYIRTTMWEQAGNIAAILEGRGPGAVTGENIFGGQGVEAGVNLKAAVANLQSVPLSGVSLP
jgi:hypothetical protein